MHSLKSEAASTAFLQTGQILSTGLYVLFLYCNFEVVFLKRGEFYISVLGMRVMYVTVLRNQNKKWLT